MADQVYDRFEGEEEWIVDRADGDADGAVGTVYFSNGEDNEFLEGTLYVNRSILMENGDRFRVSVERYLELRRMIRAREDYWRRFHDWVERFEAYCGT